jgi:hypothetical protein
MNFVETHLIWNDKVKKSLNIGKRNKDKDLEHRLWVPTQFQNEEKILIFCCLRDSKNPLWKRCKKYCFSSRRVVEQF